MGPTAVILVVVALAAALAVALRWWFRRQSAYTESLEQLYRTSLTLASAATTQGPGQHERVFEQLAELAEKLIGNTLCRIALLRDGEPDPGRSEADTSPIPAGNAELAEFFERGTADLQALLGAALDRAVLEVVHSSGTVPGRDVLPAGARTFPLAQAPAALRCLQTGKPVVVEDAARDPGPFNVEQLRITGIASIIMTPLICDGRPIGVMALANARPRRFPRTQRRLAELLAAQAAMAIANGQLYGRLRAAVRSCQRSVAQRERLYSLTWAVKRAGTLNELLEGVVRLAPEALEATFATVCFLESALEQTGAPLGMRSNGDRAHLEPRRPFRVMAVSDEAAAYPIRAGMPIDCPHSETAFRLGRPVAVTDAAADPVLRSLCLTNVGSGLWVPLIVRDGETIGTLVLFRSRPGPFADDLVGLAELFGARLAGAIANVRLREQAERDAETKATLLNELNHRVKNNLASIVGLLSIAPDGLSVEAQRWLDRVVERIGAMARAHDLFLVRREVSVRQLIETTLESVAAITPEGVTVALDFGGEGGGALGDSSSREAAGGHGLNLDPSGTSELVLPAERAVPLAMVVYELAYNAVVHGLDARGKLVVRVRSLPDRGVDIGRAEVVPPDRVRIAIDIVDDGRAALTVGAGPGVEGGRGRDRPGAAVAERPHARLGSGGIGLQLAREMVSRELRGKLDVVPEPGGGTCARIEFPFDLTSVSVPS